MGFTATNRLDKVFEVGIVLKGLDGLLEITGGVLLLPSRGEVGTRPADRAGQPAMLVRANAAPLRSTRPSSRCQSP
jgi:hypothetical protein